MTTKFSARMRHGLTAVLFTLCTLCIGHAMADAHNSRAAGKPHKVIFQVSDGDPGKWLLTLSNARNVQIELGKANVAIELVAYGPAINMLRIESEAGPGIDEAIKSGVTVVACENSMHGAGITEADMLPAIHYARSGVVYLMTKQEQGYAYIRP